MSVRGHQDIYRACHILFGKDVDVSLDFLSYIQTSGIKSAYRRKALETHPDRAIPTRGAANSDRFIETTWAYEKLLSYVQNRDTGGMGGMKRPSAPKSGFASPQPHIKRRTRKYQEEAKRPSGNYHQGSLPQRKLLLGEFLYYSGSIPFEALTKAIIWQRRQRPRLGDIAKQRGVLTEAALRKVLFHRKLGEPMGEAAVRLKLMSPASLKLLLIQQQRMQQPIGEFFVRNGYIQPALLNSSITAAWRHNRKFI